MVTYLLNIALIALEGLVLLAHTPSDKSRRLFCILASLQWVLISGLRHWSVGADTYSYLAWFERTLGYSWQDVADLFGDYITQAEDIKAPGFTLVIKLFQCISTDYQWFLVFIAVVFFTAMGWFIYRYSEDPCLSFILFSCLFYSFFAITGHRQTIATALVVFCGSELIRKKKLIPFLLLIFVAFFIHKSSICFLPFYWLSRIKINGKTMAVYWIAIALAFVFRYQFLSLLQSVVGYESYVDNEGAGAGTFMFLLMAVAVFATVFHQVISGEKPEGRQAERLGDGMVVFRAGNDIARMAMNALFIACIFASLLLINQNAMRVIQYYSLFLMILLPICARIFTKRRDMMIFDVVVAVVLVMLLVRSNPQYIFFWQGM